MATMLASVWIKQKWFFYTLKGKIQSSQYLSHWWKSAFQCGLTPNVLAQGLDWGFPSIDDTWMGHHCIIVTCLLTFLTNERERERERGKLFRKSILLRHWLRCLSYSCFWSYGCCWMSSCYTLIWVIAKATLFTSLLQMPITRCVVLSLLHDLWWMLSKKIRHLNKRETVRGGAGEESCQRVVACVWLIYY